MLLIFDGYVINAEEIQYVKDEGELGVTIGVSFVDEIQIPVTFKEVTDALETSFPNDCKRVGIQHRNWTDRSPRW